MDRTLHAAFGLVAANAVQVQYVVVVEQSGVIRLFTKSVLGSPSQCLSIDLISKRVYHFQIFLLQVDDVESKHGTT